MREHLGQAEKELADIERDAAKLENDLRRAYSSNCAHEAGHLAVGMALGYDRGWRGQASVAMEFAPGKNPPFPIFATVYLSRGQVTPMEDAICGVAGKVAQWVNDPAPGDPPLAFTDDPAKFGSAFQQQLATGEISPEDRASISRLPDEDLPHAMKSALEALQGNWTFFLWAKSTLVENGEISEQQCLEAFGAREGKPTG